MRHVVFRLEKDRYALPLSAIREVVVTPAKFSRVPRAPQAVSGIMNLRGRVVTVVELAALLRAQAHARATLVVTHDRAFAAAVADREVSLAPQREAALAK
jgi:purine-binding chemotaxis protein CheW